MQRLIEHRGRRIFTITHGAGGSVAPALVCVPGGPGVSHDYLEPLAELAATGRPVILFDPLGSGGSERPADTAWTENVYQEELTTVCAALAPAGHVVFAHSVGGFAAYPYAFGRPSGLRGLILASAPATIRAYEAAARELLALPPDELAAFERADRGQQPRDAVYVRILQDFLLEHLCRARPSPACMWRSIRGRNPAAHDALKGGGIFYTSRLRDWDVRARLREIAVPTLVTCGRHDVLRPEACRAIAGAIPGAELEVFEASSHMPHLEEPAAYVVRLARFLDAISDTPGSS